MMTRITSFKFECNVCHATEIKDTEPKPKEWEFFEWGDEDKYYRLDLCPKCAMHLDVKIYNLES